MAAVTYTATRGLKLISEDAAWMADTDITDIGRDTGTQLFTDNGFDNPASWTAGAQWTVTGSTASRAAHTSASQIYQVVSGLTVGRVYRVTIVPETYTAGSWQLYVNDTYGVVDSVYYSDNITRHFWFRASSTSHYIGIRANAACVCTFSAIRLYEDGQLMDRPDIVASDFWDITNGGTGGWTVVTGNGYAECDGSQTASTWIDQPFSDMVDIVDGESYILSFILSNVTAGGAFANIRSTGVSDGDVETANGYYSYTFVYDATTMSGMSVGIGANSTFSGRVSNLTLRPAIIDITGTDNTDTFGLAIEGLLYRDPVATGSELVGYSTNGANVGDWGAIGAIDGLQSLSAISFGCWIKDPNTDGNGIPMCFGYNPASTTYAGFGFAIGNAIASGTKNGGLFVADVGVATSTGLRVEAAEPDNKWHFWFAVADGTNWYFYEDGELIGTWTGGIPTITAGYDYVRFFNAQWNSSPAEVECSLALTRGAINIAYTSAKVKNIYDSEKHLFEPYSTYTQVDESYSVDLNLTARGQSRQTDRAENKPISGATEVLLFNDWREFDSTTGYVTRAELSPVEEFLASAVGGGTFTFDPYGSIASPDTPLICELAQDNYAVTEAATGLRQISFKVREVT